MLNGKVMIILLIAGQIKQKSLCKTSCFVFTTSNTEQDYYQQKVNVSVPFRVAKRLKGAANLTHYSCVVIILFNTGLCKSLFSTYSFGRLVFCLSALFVITACSEFDAPFINFCNICIIIIYIAGVTCFCSHLPLLT